jgi:hypothetical protein
MIDENFSWMRAHRNNIARYRRLLTTNLTDLERQFVERRVAEEQSALERSLLRPSLCCSGCRLRQQP